MWTAASNNQITKSRVANGKTEGDLELMAGERTAVADIDAPRAVLTALDRSRRPIEVNL